MSKRVQIDVPCRLDRLGDNRPLWYVMPGELLHDIAPHLAHICTFAVCMNPICHDGITNDWVVTSLETGMRVGSSFQTSKQAIAEARKVLKGIPPEYAQWRVNEERPRDE